MGRRPDPAAVRDQKAPIRSRRSSATSTVAPAIAASGAPA